MPVSRFLACLAVALAAVAPLPAAPKAPDWLEKAMSLPAPPIREGEKPGAVVIWDEAIHEVNRQGRISSVTRWAIRLLDDSDRYRAQAFVSYYPSSSTKPRLNAWTISPDGEVYSYKRKEQIDASNSQRVLHTESRHVRIDGRSRTFVDHVFAYEYTVSESTAFTQLPWYFNATLPVALSRLQVTVPDGWEIVARYRHDAPRPIVSGNTYLWEARSLPSYLTEPHAPASSHPVQAVMVNLQPPPDFDRRQASLRFVDWEDLASFTAQTMDPAADLNEDLAAKARDVLAGTEGEWEQIQAIGEYVKSVNYEHISLNLGFAGGYIPRPASETFRVGYGDCKDKSTLMRALLKLAGFKSYAVIVNAIENDAVFPEVPSPHYFNHCILAIEVSEHIQGPATLDDPDLGRLLFVDPTSAATPVGELPFDEQGGLVIVGKEGLQKLVRLPLSSPQDNSQTIELTAEILPNGALVGRAEATWLGQQANAYRGQLLYQGEKELQRNIVSLLNADHAGVKTDLRGYQDRSTGDRSFRATADIGIPRYAQPISSSLLAFKPTVISRVSHSPYVEPDRKLPLGLRASLSRESSLIYLPLEYELHEYRDGVSIERDFASYQSTIRLEEKGDAIRYQRTLEIRNATLPPERYGELREFYRQVIEAEQSPILLKRKS